MSVRTDQISWTSYREALKQRPILFLPAGAHEQHGPHLPMGTDAILATRMAEELATRLDGLVLPTLTYGYKSQARSGGGQTFPGTTSLDGKTLISMTRDILRELGRHGVERLVLLDGHFENQWFLTEGIELAQREFGMQDKSLQIIRTEYWDLCPKDVLVEIFEGDFPGFDLEHAALIETSMMLYWHSELVAVKHIPEHGPAVFEPFDHYPQDGKGVPDSGVLAAAYGASAEKGKLIIEATLDALEKAIRDYFS